MSSWADTVHFLEAGCDPGPKAKPPRRPTSPQSHCRLETQAGPEDPRMSEGLPAFLCTPTAAPAPHGWSCSHTRLEHLSLGRAADRNRDRGWASRPPASCGRAT